MLTIRQAQLTALSEIEVQKFEDWMLVHVCRFFPRQCTRRRESGLRNSIRKGIQRTARHQIKTKSDVCKFIDLMIVFGDDFDQDPRFSGADDILSSPLDSSTKMAWLYDIARELLKR